MYEAKIIWRVVGWVPLCKRICLYEHLLYSATGRRKFKEVKILQDGLINDDVLRLVSIYITLKLVSESKFIGIDGKKSLNHQERFDLQKSLKSLWFNWNPQGFKKVSTLDMFNRPIQIRVFTLADRSWHTTLALLLHPAQQALFHPSSIGYREGYSGIDVLPSFLVNMTKKSGVFDKRVLTIELPSSFTDYNVDYLMSKIVGVRKIKQALLIALNSGLIPQFINETLSLSSLLANVLLNGIENIHPCVRFGNHIAFFLNPSDSEVCIFRKVKRFLLQAGVNLKKVTGNLKSFSSPGGVDFCGWNFYFPPTGPLKASPSFHEYQIFSKSLKTIINNSNYGAVRI